MGIADPKTRKRYWEQLTNMCRKRETPVTLNKTTEANALGFNLGPNFLPNSRGDLVVNSKQIPRIDRNNVAIRISLSKERWNSIKGQWENIKSNFSDLLIDEPIESGNFPGGRKITLAKGDMDTRNESDWPNHFDWFILNLSRFAEVFRPDSVSPDAPSKDSVEHQSDVNSEIEDLKKTVDNLLKVVKEERERLNEDITSRNARKSQLDMIILKYDKK